MMKLLLFIICQIVSATSTLNVHDKMYTQLNAVTPCIVRLNGSQSFGCTSERNGNVGVIHIVYNDSDWKWVLDSERTDSCSSTINNGKKTRENGTLPVQSCVREGKEKRFQLIYKYFMVASNGFSSIVRDFKNVMMLQYNVFKNPVGVRSLNLEELYVFYEVWYKLCKLLPVIILGILPFGNFIIIIMIFYKPLKFLSSHFWSEEQKMLYAVQVHKQRVKVFKPIIQNLILPIQNENHQLYNQWNHILKLLEDGYIPEINDIAQCSSLFQNGSPFSIENLCSSQINNLLIVNNLQVYTSKINRLQEWASYMALVDLQIKHQGGVTALSEDRLKHYCFQRGMNANEMSLNEMHLWLNKWLLFTSYVEENNYSFFIHAPVIFGYNHFSNRSLWNDNN